ncbi:AAA family ATPase [Actinoplanes sp. KI2]|uniref:adenylate/guanylate cyclase domain-containing protein n=1 Tax=Actinoplanes sp. KI2 TaxID=2983315 RepID=UPI0021D58EF3|nr:adenylate/guanylate cyclase domain-containing protein [Actinoplanes sp. KI2]MCU7730685.1 AAA family ATPase [Actinoplanes sp. KI2]
MTCTACAAVMPPNTRFCPACGAVGTPGVDRAARKLVTVVFCDLVGSTALSEALDPETLRSVVLRYFAAMRRCIEHHGGTVEKFIGDAVMAVFGVPVMHDDDARRAVAATLDMRAALAELNADLDATLRVRLTVRIGVNTGPAVTGDGFGDRQALVSGETVNVAARLEQHAGADEILIGPLTRRAVGGAVRTEQVGPLVLKGKRAPVTAYRLLALDSDAPDRDRRFEVPFVGRDGELRELTRALDGVLADRRSQMVTVCGEPGIGKTRLVHAWLTGVDRAIRLGIGRCRAYGDHGSLAPLAEAVHQVLDRQARQGLPADALAVLQSGLLEDGTPGPAVASTCAALAVVLGRLTQDRPVVLVLDDCQWAGDTLLDAVDRLTALTARTRLLLLCLSRLDVLDRRASWGSGRAPHLLLGGLTPAESEVMASTLAEVAGHQSANPATVVAAAAGNPFHLEQLIAAGTEADHDELPPSLQAVLGARIDALRRPERTVLDLAAILGREFSPGQLTGLAGAGPEAAPGGPLAGAPRHEPVRAALAHLDSRRLVRPTGTLVAFASSLIHEATYQAMAKQTRAERHERAADLLHTGDTAAVTVAGHLERAYRYRVELGLPGAATHTLRRRAAALLGAAGAQALHRSDVAWAQTLLERAADLCAPGENGWAATTWQLAEARIAAGRIEEGRSLLCEVLGAAVDPVHAAHARLTLAATGGSEAVSAAAAVARQALPVFAAAGDELGQARAHIRLAQEHQFHGRHSSAVRRLDAALSHAARRDLEPVQALALGALGMSLWCGPTPVPAAIDRCRALLAEHGSRRPTVRVTLSCPLAVLLACDDRIDEANARLADASAVAGTLGYAEGELVIPIFAAAVESLAGRPQAALRLLRDADAAAVRLAADGTRNAVVRETTRLLIEQGRWAEASEVLRRLAAGPGMLRTELADLHGLRGLLAAAGGDSEQAARLAEQAVATAARTDSPIVQAVAALDQAVVLARIGRVAGAVTAAGVAGRRFAAKGHRPGARRARHLLAELTTDSGDRT